MRTGVKTYFINGITMRTNDKSPIPGSAYKQLVLDNRLAHGAFRFWHLLRDYAGKKMQCWPGQRKLSKQLGSNYESIAKWRDSLIEHGWLRIEKRKNGGHLYFLLIPPPDTTATEGGSTTTATGNGGTLLPKAVAVGATESGNGTNGIKLNPITKPAVRCSFLKP